MAEKIAAGELFWHAVFTPEGANVLPAKAGQYRFFLGPSSLRYFFARLSPAVGRGFWPASDCAQTDKVI